MDLIDAMIQRIRHIEPKISDGRILALEDALRQEFGGISNRPRKRGKTKVQQIEDALPEFTGNVEQFAIRLGCHRSTVYRVLRSRPKVARLR